MSQLAAHTEACPRGACTWGGLTAVIEQRSKIKLGQLRTYAVCGWREYDDWCAARASSVHKILPPADPVK
jgi:hypothetical protein